MRAIALTSVLLLSLAWAGSARAEDDLKLTWRAPAGCPSADDVRGAALKSVPPSARDAKQGPLEADALVERSSASAWTVKLTTKRAGSTGERQLVGSSCRAIADATVVVLSLALVAPGEAPEPVNVTATGSATGSATESAKRPSPSSPSDGHTISLGASAATDAATLPSPAVGGLLSLAWTPGHARVELDGSAWTVQSQNVSASEAGARFTMNGIDARGCYAVVKSIVEVSPCAGAGMHFVSARGHGATTNFEQSARWSSVDGAILLRLPVTPFLALRARADAFVPLTRPTFVVENEGLVHRAPIFGFRGSLGAEVNFF